MPRRRKRRPLQLLKRCHCSEQQQKTCGHHWWLRVKCNGTRQRIDLTEMFPNDSHEVAAAKAKDEALKGLIVDGKRVQAPVTDARLTFADVCDRYIAAHPKTKTSGSPRHHYYLTGMRDLEVPAALGTTVKLGLKPIDDVTAADIDHVVTAWRSRKRTKSGTRGGAVAQRHLLQSARHLFNWGKQKGFAKWTPFRDAQGTPLIKVETLEGRSRRLEDGEEERLLTSACPYIRDFVVAMLQTGCRPGELRRLQWSDLRAGQLLVTETKSKTGRKRQIPIMRTLQAILDRRRTGPDGQELSPTAHVFGNEAGDEMSRRRLCDLWHRTCKRAGVTGLHLHDLRAEAGSQLLEAGVAIHEVRDALGHTSTTMTNTYLRTRANSLQSAFEQREAHRARQGLRRVV